MWLVGYYELAVPHMAELSMHVTRILTSEESQPKGNKAVGEREAMCLPSQPQARACQDLYLGWLHAL